MNPSEDLKPLVEIENAVNKLIVEGYLLAAPDVGILSISGKLARFYKERMSTLQTPQTTAVTSEKVDKLEKITIQDFKAKANIPWQIITNKGQHNEFKYNVGQISLQAERYFNSKVVGKCDMNLLIKVTDLFYHDERQARPTLTNYFLNGIWEGVLSNYKPKDQPPIKDASYTGERRL